MVFKKAAKTVAEVSRAPRYTMSELTLHAKELFDVKAEVMAGAFYGQMNEKFTVAEAKAKIEQFMKAKVD